MSHFLGEGLRKTSGAGVEAVSGVEQSRLRLWAEAVLTEAALEWQATEDMLGRRQLVLAGPVWEEREVRDDWEEEREDWDGEPGTVEVSRK